MAARRADGIGFEIYIVVNQKVNQLGSSKSAGHGKGLRGV